jgi:hypothetical protein
VTIEAPDAFLGEDAHLELVHDGGGLVAVAFGALAGGSDKGGARLPYDGCPPVVVCQLPGYCALSTNVLTMSADPIVTETITALKGMMSSGLIVREGGFLLETGASGRENCEAVTVVRRTTLAC